MLMVENLWYRYPNSDWIIRDIDLQVGNGDLVLVIGGSGSGKSTLAIAITGIGVNVYGGEMKGDVYISGKSIKGITNNIGKYIAIVNQNPYNHFIEYRVRDDLYGYAETIYGDRDADNVVRRIVKIMNIDDLLDRYFFELSGGEVRRVAVAKALISNPDAVILDEPLMWLDDHGIGLLRESLNILKSLRKSVIVLEHRFLPLLDIADKIYLLRNGRLEEISKDMLKPREIAMKPQRNSNGSPRDIEVLRVVNTWFRYNNGRWILRNVNMRACLGELIAIYGPNGSGKSTLLRIIAGYLKPSKGFVQIYGRAIYIPQNINLFFTEATVEDEIKAICKYNRIGDRCFEKAINMLRSLWLDVDLDASPFNLSWGQKMRLAIALSMLIDDANIVLFDEPFTGLTYYERYRIANIISFLPKAKIVSLSSRDSIYMLNGDSVYFINNGVLEKIDIGNEYDAKKQMLSIIDISRRLYGYGE